MFSAIFGERGGNGQRGAVEPFPPPHCGRKVLKSPACLTAVPGVFLIGPENRRPENRGARIISHTSSTGSIIRVGPES
jgi:hypothetical protein